MKRNVVDDIPEKKPKPTPPPRGINANEIRARLLNMYPFGLIPRNRIEAATGGILGQTTMAKQDSQGTGIKGGTRVGNKICYPVDNVIEFTLSKLKNNPD